MSTISKVEPSSAATSSTYKCQQHDLQTEFHDFVITSSTMCVCKDLPTPYESLLNSTYPKHTSTIYDIDVDVGVGVEDKVLVGIHNQPIDELNDEEAETFLSETDTFEYPEPLRQCGGYSTCEPPFTMMPCDPQLAALRVFVSILLYSWRRRRKEIKFLKEHVEYLRGVSLHARTQIHLFNKLFRSEQRRNNKLMCQLKDSVESITDAKSSCDDLATSVISLKADKELIDQELRVKCKDFEVLTSLFSRTKTDLCQALAQRRLLETSLCKEKRCAKTIEEQRDKLINELSLLRTEHEHVQEKYYHELEQKDKELKCTIKTIKSLENTVESLQQKAKLLEKYCENDAALHKEIEELQKQIAHLEQCIKNSLDCRLRRIWSRIVNFQKRTFHAIHQAAYYLLPATPKPETSV